MIKRKIDHVNHFISMFNTDTGAYMRTGVLNKDDKDTGIDPFMTNFPELIDVGIMNTCVCANKCKVDCYQKAIERKGPNMSFVNYKRIVDECSGKTFQFALGGAGDVDTHEEFEKIMAYTRECEIVPNFTTSGIGMSAKNAEICRKYAGAIAVSEHFTSYTNDAIHTLLKADVKTNLHFVLNSETIDIAIDRLRNNSFQGGLNAVVFLLYKPVGLGQSAKVLRYGDERLRVFFDLIDQGNFHHKIGFDSCTIPGILSFCHNIALNSLDTCEGARWSMYITPDMKALPCSFDNQDQRYAYDISNDTIQNAWNSKQFELFRNKMRSSCPSCTKRETCMGGCPLVPEIVLCSEKNRADGNRSNE